MKYDNIFNIFLFASTMVIPVVIFQLCGYHEFKDSYFKYVYQFCSVYGVYNRSEYVVDISRKILM